VRYNRLSEIHGVKFTPPQQEENTERSSPAAQLQALAPADQTAGPVVPAALETLRTPFLVRVEELLMRDIPGLQGLQGQNLQRALSTVAAAMAISATFERLEGAIWASQLLLLQTLNSTPSGLTQDQVKAQFYDKAAAGFPLWYVSYPFDHWLGFLRSFWSVQVGARITITDDGREYLVWRVRQQKPMKLIA